jgi:hypothetical protein
LRSTAFLHPELQIEEESACGKCAHPPTESNLSLPNVRLTERVRQIFERGLNAG